MPSSPPIMLAIETSQREGGVALRDRAGDVHVERLGGGVRHDDELMPAIDRAVKAAGLVPREIEAVGVSAGPGGFTGLRIAVTTAKVLGETLGAKLVAVPSALVAAESSDIDISTVTGRQFLVALASKRNTYWKTVVYVDKEGVWRISGTPRLVHAAEPAEAVEAVLADRYFPDEARSQYEKDGIPITEPRFDPASCLRVADRIFSVGQVVDPIALGPIYPRPPEAVAIWDERQRTSHGVQ